VTPGQSLIGCEAFDVPTGVKAARVEWTTDSGTGNVGEWTTGGSTTGTSAPASTAATGTTSASAGVGSTLKLTDDEGVVYDVTLEQITDPAQPDNSFDAAPSGQVIIGVKFKITGVSGTENDSSDNDSSIVGNNGQSYQSADEGIAGCTNFNGGGFVVTPGQSLIGCEAFDVPTGVKAARVEWTTDSGTGNVGEWTVR
jgi:hypothetical protein